MKNKYTFISNFKLFTLCPGRWAVNLYIISRILYYIKLTPFAIIGYRFGQYLTGAEISYKASIGRNFWLPHPFGVVIGPTTIIGDNVKIMSGVCLGARKIGEIGKRHPNIGDNVIIGANAVVLGNITIGDNCMIGANCVIIKSTEKNSKYFGNPAIKIS